MGLTPLQEKVKCIDRSLPSRTKEVENWVIDHARPQIALRQNNLVTVCMCCGNTMVHSGSDRYVKCVECGRTVEIVEEQKWLAAKRMASRYFAFLEAINDIQVMRTFEVVLQYSAINRLKNSFVREVCRHWITDDGRCVVTSPRRFTASFFPATRRMKLRTGSTETEDHMANHAYILPGFTLIPKLLMKLATTDVLIPGNALTNIRNLLEQDYSTV